MGSAGHQASCHQTCSPGPEPCSARARRWSGFLVQCVGSADNTPSQDHLDAPQEGARLQDDREPTANKLVVKDSGYPLTVTNSREIHENHRAERGSHHYPEIRATSILLGLSPRPRPGRRGTLYDSMPPTSRLIRQPYSRPSHARPDRPSSAGKKRFLHQTIRGTTGRALQAGSSTRDRETRVEYMRKRKRKKQNRR